MLHCNIFVITMAMPHVRAGFTSDGTSITAPIVRFGEEKFHVS